MRFIKIKGHSPSRSSTVHFQERAEANISLIILSNRPSHIDTSLNFNSLNPFYKNRDSCILNLREFLHFSFDYFFPSGFSKRKMEIYSTSVETLSCLENIRRKAMWNKFEALSYLHSSDFLLASVFCAAIGIVFHALERTISSVKGRAWIVMLLSSAVLSFFGTLYVARAQYYQLWNVEHIYGEDFMSRCVLLFFLSSNVMDLILGIYHYPKFLDPFSTVAHHIFYIAFISVLLAHRYSRGFILCFFMEIPTFVLSIGTIWPTLRSDLLFGVTFLCTRLLYNAWLAFTLYTLSTEGTIWKVCIGVLCLHLYWFSKWWNKQGTEELKKLLSMSTSKESGIPELLVAET
jgi:hypothetical protein